jgi:ubiquilin
MRQTMELMRNPNAMQEMMRQQDLAMSHLENHPEGYNALRRMYEDIQEPMMEASNNAFGTAGGQQASANIPTVQSGAPNSTALPNPWGTPSATQPMGSPFGGMGGSPFGGMGGSPFGGMGANPFGGMGSAFGAGMGGMPQDPAQMQAMLQNPMVQNMMNQMASNPQLLEQVLLFCIPFLYLITYLYYVR